MTNIEALERAFAIVGSQAKLARKLGVSPQAVGKWKRHLTAERAIQIEHLTDGRVTVADMRPDLYPAQSAEKQAA